MEITVSHESLIPEKLCYHIYDEIDLTDFELLLHSSLQVQYSGEAVRPIVEDIWKCQKKEIPDSDKFIPVLCKTNKKQSFNCAYVKSIHFNKLIVEVSRPIYYSSITDKLDMVEKK